MYHVFRFQLCPSIAVLCHDIHCIWITRWFIIKCYSYLIVRIISTRFIITLCVYVFAIFRQASPAQLRAGFYMGAYVNNDKGRPQHRELSSLLFARSALVLQRPLLTISEKRMGTELRAYLPSPRRLECLISSLCHRKGSHWSLGRNYFTTLGVGTSCTPVLRSTTWVNRKRESSNFRKRIPFPSLSFSLLFSCKKYFGNYISIRN